MEQPPPLLDTTAPQGMPTLARCAALQSTPKVSSVAGITRMGPPTAHAARAASLALAVAVFAKPLYRRLSDRLSELSPNSSLPRSSSNSDHHEAPDNSKRLSTQYPTSLGHHLMSNSLLFPRSLPTHSAHKSGCHFPTQTAQT